MSTSDGQDNPVVLLSDGVWHIVESSRASAIGLCGQAIRERRAHSRLNTVGRERVCPECLQALYRLSNPHP